MTRLNEQDLEPIAGGLREYDAHLARIVGTTLRQLACRAAGVGEPVLMTRLERVTFGAVPIRSGLGVIHGFSHAVSAIVSHLGFDAFVTARSDVPGISEGIERGADVLMLADDDRYVALVPELRHIVDNSRATAQGFVAALETMKGGLEGESVLVLGCGPVGGAAARCLVARGASVALCDVESGRAEATLEEIGRQAGTRIQLAEDPHDAIRRHDLIFDATNAGGFIEAAHLTPTTIVAAPGLPCGLTQEAMETHRDRIIHDPLEIGTATMAVQAATVLGGPGGAERAVER